jgi:tRNA A37 threonylcarbamoyladenosine biosynthesis protein TsaE
MRWSNPTACKRETCGTLTFTASAIHALKLCEWPDNAAGVMPTPDLDLNIQVDEHDQRQVQLTALTPRGQELLA